MLQEIPKDENGFLNSCNGWPYGGFREWLVLCDNCARGFGLAEWQAPQHIYWLMADEVPVGMAKLQLAHNRTMAQANYTIRPTCRNMGYGTQLLGLLIQEAQTQGIGQLSLTVLRHNAYSLKIVQAHGGVIVKTTAQRYELGIDCTQTTNVQQNTQQERWMDA